MAVNDTHSAREFLQALQNQEGVGVWDTAVLKHLTLVSVEPGRVVCSMPVTETVANPMKNLHGGCAATLVDTVTTVALMTLGDVGGISTTLSVNYMSPIMIGQELTVEARVMRSGRFLSTTQVDLKLPNGTVAATGLHVKFVYGQPGWQTAAEQTAGLDGPVWRLKAFSKL
ncbi:hypothetical protein FOA52_000901 [Chlamydomonas sp. UWO 241]|nr:hypothetical protein FOA52_000901 [Chlamydomonas sp. UWO 241]